LKAPIGINGAIVHFLPGASASFPTRTQRTVGLRWLTETPGVVVVLGLVSELAPLKFSPVASTASYSALPACVRDR
jgi:hypothetical protein